MPAYDLIENKSVFNTKDYNRPIAHFTPKNGWLNDPNGLFYDKRAELWHLYYQFNPNDTVWGLPLYWGHATSKDLINWVEHEPAIAPNKDNEGIFSGSIVVDRNNTTGFFNDSIHPDQRVVAIYTYYDENEKQTQDIAYSLDGGYKFIKYDQNPVIDFKLNHFRDPKVFWHTKTNQWIMVVVKSQVFKIEIYGSLDLKSWKLHSDFTSGYYGFQYECPGLVELPIENSTNTKWVMFLAINPGSPIGGSFNQYFIGDFDGYKFTADDTQTRILDIGKDFYAVQHFSDTLPEQGSVGLAWASNWQYGNLVPTEKWRGSMSFARQYTLRDIHVNPETKILSIIQQPLLGPVKVLDFVEKNGFQPSSDNSLNLKVNESTGFFDFKVVFKVTKLIKNNEYFTFDILIQSQGDETEIETIKIGFDPAILSYYFDRSIKHDNWENGFFTDKLSSYIEPIFKDENGLSVYELYGIVDRNIVELYFNDGAIAMTNTFFMNEGKYPHLLLLVSNTQKSYFQFDNILFRHLSN